MSNNLGNISVVLQHFLVVTPALTWISSLNEFAQQDVYTNPFFLTQRQLKQSSILNQELLIENVFLEAPTVMVQWLAPFTLPPILWGLLSLRLPSGTLTSGYVQALAFLHLKCCCSFEYPILWHIGSFNLIIIEKDRSLITISTFLPSFNPLKTNYPSSRLYFFRNTCPASTFFDLK